MSININVVCTSIKEAKDYDSKKEDYGFKSDRADAKSVWVAKFEVALGKRAIKPALAYDTEEEARKFGEGKSYSALEWLRLAFG